MTAIHQDDRTGHKSDNAADPQYPETGHKRLPHDERQPEDDQCQAGIIHRQNLEGKERENQRDSANHARHHGTGVGQFEDDAVEADNHQEVGNVRIGDHRQQAGAPVRLGPGDFQTGRIQGHVARRHANGPAIHLLQQVPNVG